VPCHTLDYYAKELQSDPFYFEQETVLDIHPGIHTFDGNLSIAFIDIEELVLLGSDRTSSSSVRFQSTEILCTFKGTAGFIFHRLQNLVIANLTFTSCGLMYRNTSAALHIVLVTNLTISHTVVQNSTGYGAIAVINEPGNIVITNSAFIHNGKDIDQTGGNMILSIFGNSLVNCSAGGNGGGINLNIRSSRFLYGNTLGINPPGLYIYLEYPCYPFRVHINDSIFIGNRENQKGGSIGRPFVFVHFSTSSLSKVHVLGSTVRVTNSQFINGTAQFVWGRSFY